MSLTQLCACSTSRKHLRDGVVFWYIFLRGNGEGECCWCAVGLCSSLRQHCKLCWCHLLVWWHIKVLGKILLLVLLLDFIFREQVLFAWACMRSSWEHPLVPAAVGASHSGHLPARSCGMSWLSGLSCCGLASEEGCGPCLSVIWFLLESSTDKNPKLESVCISQKVEPE